MREAEEPTPRSCPESALTPGRAHRGKHPGGTPGKPLSSAPAPALPALPAPVCVSRRGG